MKDSDLEFVKTLAKCSIPYQIVLTKTDKLAAAQLEPMKKVMQEWSMKLYGCLPQIVATSSTTKEGK